MSRKTMLALALLATTALAPRLLGAAPTPEFPLTLFGNESVAASDGATGFTVNPAAGGLRYPAEMLLSLTDLEPTGRLYRGAYSQGGAGLAISFPENGPRSWTLASRGGQDRMRFGLAVTRLREKGGDGRATDYKLGLLSRPAPWISVGAVADHLFQTRFLGQLLGREYLLGVGVRPFAASGTRGKDRAQTLTLTADRKSVV